MAKHELVKYEYQPGSFEQFRHYVECTCGFQARLGTEVAAKSQFENHAASHGVKVVKKEETKKSKSEWNPFSKVTSNV